MSLLFETIKCCEGELYNLEYHQQRLNWSMKSCFGIIPDLNLAEVIQIPPHARKGLFRCRVTYGENYLNIEFIAHTFRNINSLKLVQGDHIDYNFKYHNRSELNALFEQRDSSDDILIVKNNFITDSSTANVIFFDGNNWITPHVPLLPGTKRIQLLEKGIIKSEPIAPLDLTKFHYAGLINAMQDMDNMPIISISHIFI